MEVFRYATTHAYERARSEGAIKPWRYRGELMPIYAFPEDPLIWGAEDTLEVIEWIEKVTRKKADLLLKFNIPISKPSMEAFVQEGHEYDWDKIKTRKHVSLYKKRDYYKPEVIIWEPIPIQLISIMDFPKALKNI